MSKTYQIGLIQGGQKMDMTQNRSLLRHKGNFPGKSKNNRSTWISLNYTLCTSLLSTSMIYVKNISNWPDPGGQKMDMTQNCSLLQQKGNFPGKSKNNETTQICLKYNLSTSLLSTLTTYVKTSQVGLIQGVKKWIWPKIVPFCSTKVIFPENLKTTKPHKYA